MKKLISLLLTAVLIMGLLLISAAAADTPEATDVLVILAVQVVFMAFFAIYVTYRMMGKDYDAIVLSAGHCGFGLGATPTAVANMQVKTFTSMCFTATPQLPAT